VLAVVLLPTIAVTEELLFRGLLIGGLGAGTGLPVGLLVVGSAVGFGLAHTAQGRHGVVVAAGLGLLLGAAYHLSGSLLLVVAAHYLVDLVEFLLHAESPAQPAKPPRQG
jgi:membrane protease YdiL (CAAX protease family)